MSLILGHSWLPGVQFRDAEASKSQAYNQTWKSSFRLVWHAAMTIKEIAILKDFP
jgi:hypothetical protein